MALSRIARKGLGPSARRRAKRLIEPIFAPIGTIQRVRCSARAIALTFDDGPNDAVTPKILDLLARCDATATFFIVTEKARNQQALIKRMIAEGHEVALHCDRHDRLTTLPLREVRDRLLAAKMELQQLGGVDVRHFRPPFGAQSLGTFAIARRLKFDVVGWGPYAEDWVEQSPESASDKALKNVAVGDIMLLHDDLEMPEGEQPPTFDRIRMVELVLAGLADRGIQAMNLNSLISCGSKRKTPWFRA